MKIAVAGLGQRAVKVLNSLSTAMPEIRVLGYVDPSPALVPALHSATPPQSFATVAQMLSDLSPDLLMVGSPNHLHLEHITAGLSAGVRVFCEKPLVASEAQSWALAELLQEHGGAQLMVGLVLRYSQHMLDLEAQMKSGLLGEVISLEANEHIPPDHGAYFMRDWRRHSAYAGGFMLEKCCHDLDLYRLITGARPVRISSFGGRRAFIPAHAPASQSPDDPFNERRSYWEGQADAFEVSGDVVDHQAALMQLESGAVMSFHANLNAPDPQRHFNVFGSHAMAEGDFHRGFLRITSARGGKLLFEQDYTQGSDAHLHHYGADRRMTDHLSRYLRQETDALPVSARDALEAGLTALACDRARLSGQIVDMTEIWARLDGYQF